MKHRPATSLPATLAGAPPAALALATLTLAAACADARPHDALMGDAHADLEAIHLERAMHRFDSARTATPGDAEAHRQYAHLAFYFDLQAESAEAWEHVLELAPEDAEAWDGYFLALRWAGTFETDRRYGEKMMRLLPEALRYASGRPGLYSNAQDVASDLGQLEAYNAILMDRLEAEADNPVFQHHLGQARVALADLQEGDRSQVLRDSLTAVLEELAARHRDDPEAAAPILYRLAYGLQPIQRDEEKDHWMSRLLEAPDRGILPDDLRYWDLAVKWQDLLYGSSASESPDEVFEVIDEGMRSPGLGSRAAFAGRRLMTVRYLADGSVADDPVEGEEPVSMAAEPRSPGLDQEHAERLFEATMDLITWQYESPISSLSRLLHYGIHPQRVLEEATNFEEKLRADRPGFIRAGSVGEARERSRQSMITSARVLQARALAQRIARGQNHGRESSKVLQDCTICVSCRLTGPFWTVPRKRERRPQSAGVPSAARRPQLRHHPPKANCLPVGVRDHRNDTESPAMQIGLVSRGQICFPHLLDATWLVQRFSYDRVGIETP